MPARGYLRPRKTRGASWWRNRYVRIVTFILVVTGIASLYIYQRVWVRDLVTGNDLLQERNDRTRFHLARLKSEWTLASSMAGVEAAIVEMNLALEPTRPYQNLVLQPPPRESNPDRYAGLMKALDKLRGHFPLVKTTEAQAGQLFKEK